MLAQRCPQAMITAIDSDLGAYRQSETNFRKSPWSSRLQAIHSPIQDFNPDEQGYDLIVSNPPFFSNSLKTPHPSRTMARHNDSLPLHDLLSFAAIALKKTGSIVVILPVTDKEKCVKLAESMELNCLQSLTVIPKPGAAPKRVILVLGRENSPEETDELTIETEKRGVYSPQFTALVRDFYLKL
jgi:tRNA1Val (adenine37-N6)-methyltransferase